MSIPAEYITGLGVVLTFLGGVIGSYVVWSKTNKEDKTEFRRDFIEMTNYLHDSVAKQDDKIEALIAQLERKESRIRMLEHKINLIRVLIVEYNIKDPRIEELLSVND
jgi:hypothetical protein